MGFDAADGDGVVPLRKYPSFRVALSPAIGSAGLARFFFGIDALLCFCEAASGSSFWQRRIFGYSGVLE